MYHLIPEEDSIRSSNRSRILRLLFEKGLIPRFHIADIVGLNSSSVTRIVAECKEAQFIIETNDQIQSASIGRKPVPLALNPSLYYVAGIHIGVNFIDMGLMNLQGRLVRHTRHERPKGTVESIVSFIKQHIQQLCKIHPGILLSVGVALNGQMDTTTGTILGRNVFLGWENVPLRDMLEKELRVRVEIDTNVYAIALAEYIRNPLPPDQPLLLIHTGGTIGMGLVVNHVVVRGRKGLSGFLEHVPWQIDGPACECGKRGCLTALLSDRALIARAADVRPDLDIPNILVLLELSKHHAELKQLIHQRAEYISRFLISMVSLHDPARLIITGLSDQEQMALVKQYYEQQLASLDDTYAELQTTNMEKGAIPLVGAATLALNAVLSPALSIVKVKGEHPHQLSHQAILPLHSDH